MPLRSLDGAKPRVPADGGYWLAPSAEVIGKVVLGANVGIWFGAVLRGDNEPIVIGDDTNIQEHCVLHTDMGSPLTIGRGCTVGHRAVLHGCTVGDNCLIGMGAIVLNGAVIGENSLVGAGALVPERRVIPPNSLVLGAPGKAVRPLTEDEVARNRLSAAAYVANWKRFAAGLQD